MHQSMNTKLLMFGLMFLLVFSISIEPVSAGWFEDTINWFKEILGFTQEEAKAKAMELIGYGHNINFNPDNSSTLQIWGGLRNVYEGGKWYEIENAPTLMETYNKGLIKKIYIEDDKLHDFEIVDLNYTSLKVKPILKDSKELNIDIPIKLDGVKVTDVNLKSLEGDNYTFTSENIFANNYTFGPTSTTIHLTTANVDNLDDSYVTNKSGDENDNMGGATNIWVYDGADRTYYAYMKWNISIVPSGKFITSAKLGLRAISVSGTPKMVNIYHVYNDTWNEGTGTETICTQNSNVCITWNNQPCWNVNGGYDEDQCNITSTGGNELDEDQVSGANEWSIWDITDGIKIDYLLGKKNSSYFLAYDNQTGAGLTNVGWDSKEGTTLPYVNLTFGNTIPTEPIPIVNSTNVAQTNYSDEDLACNFLCNDTSGYTLTNDVSWYKDGIFSRSNSWDSWVEGKFSNALEFDGVDDYVDFGVKIVDYNFSIGFWFKTLSAVQTNLISLKYGSVRPNIGILSNKLIIWQEANNYLYSNDEVNDGLWHFAYIEYNYNTTESNIYLDGVLNEGSNTFTGVPDPIDDFVIGATSGGSNSMNGSIDEVRIWNRTLTNLEILDLNNSNTVNRTDLVAEYTLNESSGFIADDSSDNSNDGTLYGFTSCTNPSYQSIILSNSYISVNDLWSCSVNITNNDNLSSSTVFSNNITINSALVATTVKINSTDGSNYTNQSLWCDFDCKSNIPEDTMTYSLEFLENGTDVIYSILDSSCVNPSNNSIELTSSNTTSHYFYSCKVNISSLTEDYINVYSKNLTIRNHPPYDLQVVPPSPANETETPNLTNTFNCSAQDVEGDTLNYEIYLDGSNPPTTLIANETGAVTNTTIDGKWWWRCKAVDGYGGTSSYSDARYLTIDNSTIRNYTASYDLTTTEGTRERFEFNVSYNPIQLDYIDAEMIYQNVHYDLTRVDLNSILTRFYIDLVIPDITSSTTAGFYLNVTNVYNNGSVSYETNPTNWTQTINVIGIKDCTFDPATNTTQALAANYTFFEEDTKYKFADNRSASDTNLGNLTNFEATFILYKDDISSNNTFSLKKTNVPEVYLCISPADETYNVVGQIEYKNDSYDLRNYYYDGATFNNKTQNTTLYLLHEDDADLITITVQDKSQAVQEGVYISVQRYDVGTNVFDLVAMGRSDFDGQDIIPLRLYDAWYRFILTQNQNVKYIDSNSRRLSSTTLTLNLDEETLADDLRNFDTMTYTLTNTSNSIILTFNDVSGASSKNCLTVYKTNSSDSGFTCYGDDYCLSSSSGTITCNIGVEIGEEGGVYIWRYYSTINPTKLVASGTISAVTKALIEAIGVVGLLGAFLIILSMGLAGVSQRKVSYVVIFTFIGVLACRLLGLLDVSYVWIVVLGILGGIVIVVTKD